MKIEMKKINPNMLESLVQVIIAIGSIIFIKLFNSLIPLKITILYACIQIIILIIGFLRIETQKYMFSFLYSRSMSHRIYLSTFFMLLGGLQILIQYLNGYPAGIHHIIGSLISVPLFIYAYSTYLSKIIYKFNLSNMLKNKLTSSGATMLLSVSTSFFYYHWYGISWHDTSQWWLFFEIIHNSLVLLFICISVLYTLVSFILIYKNNLKGLFIEKIRFKDLFPHFVIFYALSFLFVWSLMSLLPTYNIIENTFYICFIVIIIVISMFSLLIVYKIKIKPEKKDTAIIICNIIFSICYPVYIANINQENARFMHDPINIGVRIFGVLILTILVLIVIFMAFKDDISNNK